jgi:hypothetical protein
MHMHMYIFIYIYTHTYARALSLSVPLNCTHLLLVLLLLLVLHGATTQQNVERRSIPDIKNIIRGEIGAYVNLGFKRISDDGSETM